MKFYNTLTRQVDTIKPISSSKVTVYTCGPTVYDYPHIGNWFTFVRYDVLVRTLKANGYKVDWAMNITDVGHLVSDADEGEDKLEKGAKREGKTAWQVAQYYGEYFLRGLKRLNFTQPNTIPKATEHIQEQIALVQKLENNGYTYVIDDGVYFDTSKFNSYADFGRLNLEEQQAGARVEQNPQKRNPHDFALWKLSPPGVKRDMEWESPWGKGFPGWHLECSAMAMKYLGNTIDIHGGGIDHIPVHHTNEIAQSEATTNITFSNYWIHSNFCLVEGKKMSKSLGNFYTLEDIEKHGFKLDAFRMLILESSYRSESNFDWKLLQAANNRLVGLCAMADLQFQTNKDAKLRSNNYFKGAYDEALQALSDDLNTAIALSVLSRVKDEVESDGLNPKDLDSFKTFLGQIDDLLGLKLNSREDIDSSTKELINKREKARLDKNWLGSDKLREKLASKNIALNDTSFGAVWHRTSV